MNLLCDDLERARANRERVAQGHGNKFYDNQKGIIEGWEHGRIPPKGLIVDNVSYAPIVGMGGLSWLDAGFSVWRKG